MYHRVQALSESRVAKSPADGIFGRTAVNAILFAVVLALLRFIKSISRPRVEILGKIEGLPGLHSLERHEGGQEVPGVLLFRFNEPITFFNEPYFKRELMRAIDEAGPNLRHVVLNLLPVTNIDATGLLTLTELVRVLETSRHTIECCREGN